MLIILALNEKNKFRGFRLSSKWCFETIPLVTDKDPAFWAQQNITSQNWCPESYWIYSIRSSKVTGIVVHLENFESDERRKMT